MAWAMTVPVFGLVPDLFLPDRLQPSFFEPAVKLPEWPCTLVDALAACNVKSPLVLGAGQLIAGQGQVRDVGYLVGTAAVIDIAGFT